MNSRFFKLLLTLAIAVSFFTVYRIGTTAKSVEWPSFGGSPENRRATDASQRPDSDDLVKYDEYGADVGIITTKLVVSKDRLYAGSRNSKLYCLSATAGWRMWEFKTGEQVKSSPVVSEGHIYFGSDDGIFYCLEDRSDKAVKVWSYNAGDDVQTIPAIFQGSVVFGSRNGYLTCLNSSSGKLKWRYKAGGNVTSSPLVMNERIYFGCHDKSVYCLDKSGKQVWKYKTGDQIESSPCSYGKTVIIGSDDGKVYALDSTTGRLVWSFASRNNSDFKSSPICKGSSVYIGSDDSYLYCLNANTGKKIWEFDTNGSIVAIPNVADKVYIGSTDGFQYCVETGNGKKVWSFKCESSIFSGSAISDGRVFFGDLGYNVFCLDSKNGNKVWEFKTGWYVRSSPVISNNHLFFGSDDYRLHVLDPVSLTPKMTPFMTGGQIVSTPAVYGNKVVFGSFDGFVYCIDYISKKLAWKYKTLGRIEFDKTVGNGDSSRIQIRSSPIIVKDPVDGQIKVYIASNDKNLYCLNLDSGKLVWSFQTGYNMVSSPTYSNGRVYIGSYDGRMYCLDARTKRLLWSQNFKSEIQSTAAYSNGKVMFGVSDGNFYCLNAPDGRKIWNFKAKSGISSSPAVSNGKVYLTSHDRSIYCLDEGTGRKKWSFTTGNVVLSSPTIAGDRLYCGSTDQKLYCIDESTGLKKWEYKTEGDIWTSPLVYEKKIYIGSDDFKLYVFNQRADESEKEIVDPPPLKSENECSTRLVFRIGSTQWQTSTIKEPNFDQTPMVTAPVILYGTTFMVLRYVANSVGCYTNWQPETKSITIIKPYAGISVGLQINSRYATITKNGIQRVEPIDKTNDKIKPMIRDGVTVIPLRFVATAIELDVSWDKENEQIFIQYSDPYCIKPAPEINKTDTDGQLYILSDHKSKPVLISFLVPDHNPSFDALNALVKLHEKFNQSFDFVTISPDINNEAAIRVMKNDFSANWPFIVDDGTICDSYESEYVPCFVLIDRRGQIYSKIDNNLENLEQEIMNLLDSGS